MNTILIIEDQLSTRKLLRNYLGSHYEVFEMDNATDALIWLKEGNIPRIIIADILMPGMTGIEFLGELNNLPGPLPPVVMLTSVENSTEKLKCFNLGVRDYMIKPFNPEELLMRVNVILKN